MLNTSTRSISREAAVKLVGENGIRIADGLRAKWAMRDAALALGRVEGVLNGHAVVCKRLRRPGEVRWTIDGRHAGSARVTELALSTGAN